MNPVKINRVLGGTRGGHKNVLLTFNKSYMYATGNLILTLNKYNEGLFFYLFVEKADEEIEKYLFSLGANIKLYDFEFDLDIGTNKYPAVTSLRLFVPYLIQDDIEYLLYLDTDMICKGNIDALFNTPSEDSVIAMSPGLDLNFSLGPPVFDVPYPATLYCNSGTVMFYMKKYKTFTDCDSLQRDFNSLVGKMKMPDQDFLNYRFHGKIHFLKQTYNFYSAFFRDSNYKRMLEYAKIIHFIEKPWNWRTNYRVMKAFLKYSIDNTIKRKVLKTLIKRTALITFLWPFMLTHYVLFLIYPSFKHIELIRKLKEKVIR